MEAQDWSVSDRTIAKQVFVISDVFPWSSVTGWCVSPRCGSTVTDRFIGYHTVSRASPTGTISTGYLRAYRRLSDIPRLRC